MKKKRMFLASESYKYISILLLCGFFGLFIWKAYVFSTVMLVFCGYIIFFFRIPKRYPSIQVISEESLLAPADGKIVYSGIVPSSWKLEYEDYFKEPSCYLISIFMNIFNVHMNWVPIDASIVNKKYRPGKFFNAGQLKARDQNEQLAYYLETPIKKKKIVVVQVAGLIARRIVSDVEVGDRVRGGDFLGLIEFGSRVDVYLPGNSLSFVGMNDKVYGGKTIISQI